LGLAISRSIVAAHRGRIQAENNADRGATFRCFLPLANGTADGVGGRDSVVVMMPPG
jgi:two-component system, LuxR family, sensor kinase FixL